MLLNVVVSFSRSIAALEKDAKRPVNGENMKYILFSWYSEYKSVWKQQRHLSDPENQPQRGGTSNATEWSRGLPLGTGHWRTRTDDGRTSHAEHKETLRTVCSSSFARRCRPIHTRARVKHFEDRSCEHLQRSMHVRMRATRRPATETRYALKLPLTPD